MRALEPSADRLRPGFRTRYRPSGLPAVWLKRGASAITGIRHARRGPTSPNEKGDFDGSRDRCRPHKGSHTAVAVDQAEKLLGELKVRSSPGQVDRIASTSTALQAPVTAGDQSRSCLGPPCLEGVPVQDR